MVRYFWCLSSLLILFQCAGTEAQNNNTDNATLSPGDDNYVACPLCADVSHTPQFNFSVFTSGANVFSCQSAYKLGTLNLPPENCTFWQSRGSTICGCASEPPVTNNDCTLCEDGSDLPEPFMAVGSGSSSSGRLCAQYQADAVWDDPDNCPLWQQTIGIYCGCGNTPQLVTDDKEICRICDGDDENNLLTLDALLEVSVEPTTHSEQSSGSKSCGELEFEANFLVGADCNQYLALYRQECCKPKEVEQKEEPIDDSESAAYHHSYSYAVIIVYVSSHLAMFILGLTA